MWKADKHKGGHTSVPLVSRAREEGDWQGRLHGRHRPGEVELRTCVSGFPEEDRLQGMDRLR